MKTDSLYYELFPQWPAAALDLAWLDPAAAERYTFRAEELKQAAFRLDDSLYPRLFAELFRYPRHTPPSPVGGVHTSLAVDSSPKATPTLPPCRNTTR